MLSADETLRPKKCRIYTVRHRVRDSRFVGYFGYFVCTVAFFILSGPCRHRVSNVSNGNFWGFPVVDGLGWVGATVCDVSSNPIQLVKFDPVSQTYTLIQSEHDNRRKLEQVATGMNLTSAPKSILLRGGGDLDGRQWTNYGSASQGIVWTTISTTNTSTTTMQGNLTTIVTPLMDHTSGRTVKGNRRKLWLSFSRRSLQTGDEVGVDGVVQDEVRECICPNNPKNTINYDPRAPSGSSSDNSSDHSSGGKERIFCPSTVRYCFVPWEQYSHIYSPSCFQESNTNSIAQTIWRPAVTITAFIAAYLLLTKQGHCSILFFIKNVFFRLCCCFCCFDCINQAIAKYLLERRPERAQMLIRQHVVATHRSHQMQVRRDELRRAAMAERRERRMRQLERFVDNANANNNFARRMRLRLHGRVNNNNTNVDGGTSETSLPPVADSELNTSNGLDGIAAQNADNASGNVTDVGDRGGESNQQLHQGRVEDLLTLLGRQRRRNYRVQAKVIKVEYELKTKIYKGTPPPENSPSSLQLSKTNTLHKEDSVGDHRSIEISGNKENVENETQELAQALPSLSSVPESSAAIATTNPSMTTSNSSTHMDDFAEPEFSDDAGGIELHPLDRAVTSSFSTTPSPSQSINIDTVVEFEQQPPEVLSLNKTNENIDKNDDTQLWLEENDDFDINDDNVCAICYIELEVGDRLGDLKCKHDFHVDCLKIWLNRRNVCPLCLCPDIAVRRQQVSTNSVVVGNMNSSGPDANAHTLTI